MTLQDLPRRDDTILIPVQNRVISPDATYKSDIFSLQRKKKTLVDEERRKFPLKD